MNKLFKTALFAGGVVAAIKGLDTRYEITYEEVVSSSLPKNFDGYRIVHLSDFHNDSNPELLPIIRELEPDIILCTGDMADDEGSYFPALNLIKGLVKMAPCLMVTGNHDVWRGDSDEMEKEMLEAGARFLHNKRVYIARGDEKIAISGIDDPFSLDSDKIETFISEKLDELSEYDGFEIMMFHRAKHLDSFEGTSFDLILSGHMHGGHVRIPGIGGVSAPRSSFSGKERCIFPKYFGGRYERDNTVMIVSRGMGNPMIIPRVFNRPEIVVVTLKTK